MILLGAVQTGLQIKKTYHRMQIEIVAIISAIVGGVITGVFNLLRTRNESSTDDRKQFRTDIMQRLKSLEAKQNQLEQDVIVWKGRYWSLYTWLVNFCFSNGIAAAPPSFHEMELTEMESKFKEREYADPNEDH